MASTTRRTAASVGLEMLAPDHDTDLPRSQHVVPDVRVGVEDAVGASVASSMAAVPGAAGRPGCAMRGGRYLELLTFSYWSQRRTARQRSGSTVTLRTPQ
jgi:hypothetical protein